MKILHITVRSDIGGGPKHVDLLLSANNKDDCVFVAAPLDVPYGKKWEKDNSIQDCYTLKHRSFSVSKLIGLNRFIRKNGIQILHSHGKGAGIYSRLLKLLVWKVKVVHTFHGYNLRHSKLFNFISLSIEKVLALLTNHFICVSEGEKNKVIASGLRIDDITSVVYNGIEEPMRVQARKREKFSIATVSRFDYAKNMDFCYTIVEQMPNKEDLEFLWIGDGEDKERLEVKCKKDGLPIIFTGFSDKPMELVESCDMVLSTSRFEGLPFALIEACALSKPIVATNVVGNNEVVKEWINGFLFRSADEAVRKIQSVRKDPELMEKFKRGARLTYEEKFTAKKMISRINEIYLQIIKGK